jgi:hypothetical protein
VNPTFERYVAIDYSGAKTPSSSALKTLDEHSEQSIRVHEGKAQAKAALTRLEVKLITVDEPQLDDPPGWQADGLNGHGDK